MFRVFLSMVLISVLLLSTTPNALTQMPATSLNRRAHSVQQSLYSYPTDLASLIDLYQHPGIVPSSTVLDEFRASGQPMPLVKDWPAPLSAGPIVGTRRILVILIQFPDHVGTRDQAYYQSLLFSGAQGSLSHYYSEVSYGLLSLTGAMAGSGWYMSDYNEDWWGDDYPPGPMAFPNRIDDANSYIFELAREAVVKADANVNFKSYDTDDDNILDPEELSLAVVHAGSGQESSGYQFDIWSHRWYIFGQGYTGYYDTFVDGVRVSKHPEDNVGGYFMLAEDSPMGTFAHEFGHDLGLPDLYDTDYSSDGVGVWSLMGSGNWLGTPSGSSPAHPDAWSKVTLGWISPTLVTAPIDNALLAQVETNAIAYQLMYSSTEYFLVENRQRAGYDSSLPGTGILIWHIDETMPDNTNEAHKKVDLEEAHGGVQHLDFDGGDMGGSTDPYFSNPVGFTFATDPSSKAYSGESTGCWAMNISDSGTTMTANLNGHPSAYSDTLIIHTIGQPESLDPAWAYETTSAEVVQNVYETLVFFDFDFTDGPYQAGKVDSFIPKLAESWTIQDISETSPEGLLWKKRFTFEIRTSVMFHNGHIMTAEDIEYSFERSLVQDRDAGPIWMLYEPLLNTFRAQSPSNDPSWGLKIEHAIQCNSTHVWLNLVRAYPETAFLQILSQSWASVVEKSWAEAQGDLNIASVSGGWNNWAEIWDRWHNPTVSFIKTEMMGTGPYKSSFWDPSGTPPSWSVVWFPDYWDGWPARVSQGSTERIGGYIDTVLWNVIPESSDRKASLLMGESDMAYLPRMYRDQMLGQPGVRCYSPLNLMAIDAFFFTFNIDSSSPYLGIGFDPSSPYIIAEDRIPIDLFSEINVRLAFAYAFDYDQWLMSAYLNEGTQPSDPIVQGQTYDNPTQAKYSINLANASTLLQTAWGGALWSNGMSFTIVYNAGNEARQTAAELLASNINSLNPKFHLTTTGVSWDSVFLPQMVEGILPIFISGWAADTTDPHGIIQPFMHTQGAIAAAQRYSNPVVDSLIEAGIETPDGPERQQIYYDLQSIYYDEVPSIPLVQPTGRHWERDWVKGWYYNPLYGGSISPGIESTAPATPTLLIYHLWKMTPGSEAIYHLGDADNDGNVNILDAAAISAHWFGPPAGPCGYNPKADLTGGTSDGQSVPGIPDGKVDILDAALASAWWCGPPKGPSHP